MRNDSDSPLRTVGVDVVALARDDDENDFKAYFIGAFHVEESRVVLRGNFRFNYGVSVFMLVWLSVTLLVALGVIDLAAPQAEKGVRHAALLFFGFGLLMTLLGNITLRRDAKWLSSYLKELLQ